MPQTSNTFRTCL